MDSKTALELVKQGATLLLLGVPQHTIFGIDTQVFTVGPAFKGLKMIPPGTHFVFYSSSSRDGNEFSPVTGFFCHVGVSEVIVRKWDRNEERLVKVSEEEVESYSKGVRSMEFDKHLGPYNLSQYGDWKLLSNYITKSVTDRIEPIGGEISVGNEPATISSTSSMAMENTLDEQLKNSNSSTSSNISHRRGCYYTSIPRVIRPKGVQGHELTSLNLDKTQLLESLLVKDYEGSEDSLLGELQFAFIAFLMGQSLEAFLQWKSIVSLLLGCTEAPFHTRTQLFVKFMKVVYFQLKFGLQKDSADSSVGAIGASALLDDSWFSADSFLHRLCKDFFALVQEASVVDGDLLTWTRRLKELLENSLGWEFQKNNMVDGVHFEEDDEYAPVVEMLDVVDEA